MLNGLILADRTVEYDALARIARRALHGQHAKPYRFGSNQNPLRVHAVQNIFEPASLFADAIIDRNLEPLDEELVGVDGLAPHLLDLVDLDPVAIEVGVEQAQPLRCTLDLLERRGSRQEQ